MNAILRSIFRPLSLHSPLPTLQKPANTQVAYGPNGLWATHTWWDNSISIISEATKSRTWLGPLCSCIASPHCITHIMDMFQDPFSCRPAFNDKEMLRNWQLSNKLVTLLELVPIIIMAGVAEQNSQKIMSMAWTMSDAACWYYTLLAYGCFLTIMLCTFIIISLTGKMVWHLLLKFSQALNGPPTNTMISKYGEVLCTFWILLRRMEGNCLDGNLVYIIVQYFWVSQRSMPKLPHCSLIWTLDTSALSQFHCVFDSWFSTVISESDWAPNLDDPIWDILFGHSASLPLLLWRLWNSPFGWWKE